MTNQAAQLPYLAQTRFPADAAVTHTISLGAGVQSTVMYLMAAHGLLRPTPQVAIFADTRWEPPDIYQHLEWLHKLSPRLPCSIPIEIISAGDIYNNVWNARRIKGNHPWTDIPTFTLNPDGSQGMGARQCTENYKVKPIIRHLRDLIGRPAGRRHSLPPFAAQWLGISRDEWTRMKDPRDQWIENIYPLVDLHLTRADCQHWFEEHYPGRPLAKSSCVGCPYHSDREWLRIYRQFPDEARRAIALDARLREPARAGKEPNVDVMQYLHRSRRPLDEVLMEIHAQDRRQPSLIPDETGDFTGHCDGYCAL